MGRWIATVMKPIFNKFKIVSNTPTVYSYPMDTLYPLTIKAIFLEGGAAEIKTLGCLLLADEEKHDDNDGIIDLGRKRRLL